MPVSFSGYVLDRLIESEFIVVEARIDARNPETKLGNPAFIKIYQNTPQLAGGMNGLPSPLGGEG